MLNTLRVVAGIHEIEQCTKTTAPTMGNIDLTVLQLSVLREAEMVFPQETVLTPCRIG